jgi:hypothetical protein
MTRNSDLYCRDIFECTHQPETPIIDEVTLEILYWVCRCGKRHEIKSEIKDNK